MNKLKISLCIAAMSAGVAHAEINFRGFGSVVMGQAINDDDNMMPLGYEEKLNTNRDSLFALQAESELSEGLSATLQLVSKGKADYKPVMQWAYITYEFNDSWEINVGRLRAPFYRYSDLLDVRYALNWITAPERLYNFDFPGYDGINLMYNTSIGGLDSKFQIIYGELDGKINPNEPDETEALLESSIGIAWEGSINIFNLRASYYQSEATILNANTEAFAGGITGRAAQFSDPGTLASLSGAVAGLASLSQQPGIPAELSGALDAASKAGASGLDYNNQAVASMLDSASNGRILEDESQFVSLGFGFEYGNFLFDAEWLNYQVTESLLQDVEAMSVTVGWRMDNWLFFAATATEERKYPTDAFDALASPEEFIQRANAYNEIAESLLSAESPLVADASPLPAAFKTPAVEALAGLQAGLTGFSQGYAQVYSGTDTAFQDSTLELQNTTIGLRYDIFPAAIKFAYEIAEDKKAGTDAGVARISLDFVF